MSNRMKAITKHLMYHKVSLAAKCDHLLSQMIQNDLYLPQFLLSKKHIKPINPSKNG